MLAVRRRLLRKRRRLARGKAKTRSLVARRKRSQKIKARHRLRIARRKRRNIGIIHRRTLWRWLSQVGKTVRRMTLNEPKNITAKAKSQRLTLLSQAKCSPRCSPRCTRLVWRTKNTLSTNQRLMTSLPFPRWRATRREGVEEGGLVAILTPTLVSDHPVLTPDITTVRLVPATYAHLPLTTNKEGGSRPQSVIGMTRQFPPTMARERDPGPHTSEGSTDTRDLPHLKTSPGLPSGDIHPDLHIGDGQGRHFIENTTLARLVLTEGPPEVHPGGIMALDHRENYLGAPDGDTPEAPVNDTLGVLVEDCPGPLNTVWRRGMVHGHLKGGFQGHPSGRGGESIPGHQNPGRGLILVRE